MRIKIYSTQFAMRAIVCSLLAFLAAGCAGNYGRYTLDSEVLQSFKEKQVPSDYRYFYYGFDTTPYALVGIEKQYDASSSLWREVEPNTEKFRRMIDGMWGDFGYAPFAARIIDPSGNPVGVLYTSIREVVFKFSGNNRIVVIPHTPFLWGPTVNGNPSGGYYGSIDSNLAPPNRQASNP